jgi:type I restriction enzyme M protein
VPTYEGLFQNAPAFFDVVLMNPPFGGKEGKESQTPYAYATNATQVLFLQNVLQSMKPGSRCGIVLDEGVLFRVDSESIVKVKEKLLQECDVYCIVSLPGGVFTAAGAGVKTNLVFFTKGKQTERIWFYDLADVKVGKKTPLTLAHFDDFFRLLPDRGDSERSWTMDFIARLEKAQDEAQPHRARAEAAQTEAKALETRWKELRKIAATKPPAVQAAAEAWKTKEREAREALAKAVAIESAAYDLKAVNPHRVTEEDKRTPGELLAEIETKGEEAEAALAQLRALLAQPIHAAESATA